MAGESKLHTTPVNHHSTSRKNNTAMDGVAEEERRVSARMPGIESNFSGEDNRGTNGSVLQPSTLYLSTCFLCMALILLPHLSSLSPPLLPPPPSPPLLIVSVPRCFARIFSFLSSSSFLFFSSLNFSP